jgi:hypothetical protein
MRLVALLHRADPANNGRAVDVPQNARAKET